MEKIIGKFTEASNYAKSLEDEARSQTYDIINSKAFSGKMVALMPDAHAGKSGPCGLVAEIGEYVCPEHVGVDIGCTVSAMFLDKKVPEEKIPELEMRIKRDVPMGKKTRESVKVNEKDFYRFLTTGFNKYRQKWPEMLQDLPTQVTEDWLSKKLAELRMDPGVFWKSLGTIGGGNHFIEYDENENNQCFTLHFGSRNFGVKVASYWTSIAKEPKISKKELKEETKRFLSQYKTGDKKTIGPALKKHLEEYKDSKKCGVPGYLSGEYMSGYLQDMCLAQLYSAYNHLTVQKIIEEHLKKYGIKIVKIIETTHNYIDLEDHILRKSAVSAKLGEEFLVPFNMRDGLAVCIGKGNPMWINSCSHGAGRKMSRTKAKASITVEEMRKSMEGIYSTTLGLETLDEAPQAYKDTEEIVEIIQETCQIEEFLKPKINIKGGME